MAAPASAAPCGLRMARQAFARQAGQSALAVGVALLALLVVSAATILSRGAIALAQQLHVPLGEVSLLTLLMAVDTAASEAAALHKMGGRANLWLLAGAVAVLVAMWAAALGIAAKLGVADFGAAGLPVGVAMSLVSRPIATLLTPWPSTWRDRRRRSVRETGGIMVRASSMFPAMTVLMYVYLTVFTRLAPLLEVLVMGVTVPLLQAGCMTLVSRMVARMERRVRKRVGAGGLLSYTARERAATPAPSTPAAPAAPAAVADALGGAPSVLAAQVGATAAADTLGSAPAGTLIGASSELKTRTQVVPMAAIGKGRTAAVRVARARMSLVMVLMAEVFYSAGAFFTLALADSTQTFSLALSAMLAIEVVQVSVHVKVRRLVSLVVDQSLAEHLRDYSRLRQWLLFQELGEKIGILLAVGLLAIEKTFDRGIPALHAISTTHLAGRALVMVLVELVGDVVKDVLSQWLGVITDDVHATRVRFSPLEIFIVLLVCLNASLVVQIGLAFGTT